MALFHSGNVPHPSKRFRMDTLPKQPAKAKLGMALQNVSKPRVVKQNDLETLADHEISDKSIANATDQTVENQGDVKKVRPEGEAKLHRARLQEQLQKVMTEFHVADVQWREHSTDGTNIDDTTTSSVRSFCNTVLHRLEDREGEKAKDLGNLLKVVKLEGNVKRLRLTEASLKAEISGNGNDLERLRRQRAELRVQIENLTTRVDEADAKVQHLKEELRTKDSDVSDRTEKIATLDTVVAQYRAEADTNIKAKDLEIEGKDERIEELSKELDTTRQELKDMKSRREQALQDLQKLQDKIQRERLDHEKHKVSSEKTLTSYRDTEKLNVAAYKKKVLGFEAKVDGLQKNLSAVKNETNVLKGSIKELQDWKDGANGQFIGELQDALGLTPDVCWATLTRLNLPITRTGLQHTAPTTGLLIHSSRIYGKLGKRISDTKDIVRNIVKIMLCIKQGQDSWGIRIWNLWCTIEDPNSVPGATREEVFAPLLGMVRSIIDALSSQRVSHLSIWLACQLARSLLRYAPLTLELPHFFKEPGWIFQETRLLPQFGWEQLVEAENRHQLPGSPFDGLCRYARGCTRDVRAFECMRGQERVEVCMALLPSEEVMIVVRRRNRQYFIWHNVQAACKIFIAKLVCWIRLDWGAQITPEFLELLDDDGGSVWSWFVEKGLESRDTPSDFAKWDLEINALPEGVQHFRELD
ncbi:MAG: hypothetical protein M1830_008074 [Pleopsidium flavum]|nr:MAG: hypothetical protein M1830_008074 [Pleopsidium flavum]